MLPRHGRPLAHNRSRANIGLMVDEASEVRRGRPVMLTNCKTGEGVAAVVDRLVEDVIFAA